MRRLCAAIGALLLWTVQALALPALDGHATTTGHATTSYTVTLTTSLTSDVIIVAIATSRFFATAPATVTGISDTAGLTWTSRVASGAQINANNGARLTVYEAYAASALSSDVITITTSAGTASEDVAISAFGVNGVTNASTAPYDTNGSLPDVVLGNGGGGLSATVSTSQSNDMVLSIVGSRDNPGQAFYPSGFTVIDNVWDSSQNGVVVTAYKLVTGTVSTTYTMQTGDTASTPLVDVIDALKGGAAVPPSSGSFLLRGVGG